MTRTVLLARPVLLPDYRARLERNGIAIAYSADNVKIGGIGIANLFAVRDPDGNVTEFFETKDKGR